MPKDTNSAAATVLIVDDEAGIRQVLQGLIERMGFACVTAEDAEGALEKLEREAIDVVITDLQMPGHDGLWLLQQVRSRWAFVSVIVLTAHGSVDNAVRAMHLGARDFLTKPVDRHALDRALQGAVPVAEQLFVDGRALDMVAASPAMKQVVELCARMASSQAPVLITGPSGSGKEVVARTLHAMGGAKRPFVAVNCAALPEGLLESELFGHVRGAFTGATCDKPGRVELAKGGVLFLDEIGDLPAAAQVKLLRLVQENTYERVGGVGTQTADVRIVAATHRDLRRRVAEGQFREDLFFRLNVLPIALRPLAERPEDIVPLAEAFLLRAQADGDRPPARLSDEARQNLRSRSWPGNARELSNLMQRIAVLCGDPIISAADIDTYADMGQIPGAAPDGAASRQDHQRRQIEEMIARAGGNRSQAARLLGISRRTLYNRLQQLDIQ